MILRPSYLHSGISCTRKTASLCGIRSQVPICVLTSIGIPMLKIRRSRDRLIFNMGIPIPGKDGLYIETGPWASQEPTF